VFASLPFIMGAIGNLAGGVFERQAAQKYGIKTSRRLVGSVCLALSAVCLFPNRSTTGKLTGIVFLAWASA